MPKVEEHKFDGGAQYWFWCPGCECSHAFTVPPWTFNGDVEKPTFSPSLLCNQSHPPSRCHSLVNDGKIQFLGDCHHKLAGQTVELPEAKIW
jgi:hypothetical protein